MQWVGQYCERVAQLLQMDLPFSVAFAEGLTDAYAAGPDNMLR